MLYYNHFKIIKLIKMYAVEKWLHWKQEESLKKTDDL